MIKEKTFYKSFMVLALSLALQNLLTYGVNLMDTMMLGRYSQDAMGGVSLCNQVQFLLQMLVVGAGEGAVVMGSQYWGKNKLDPIPHIIGVALRFGGSLAVLMFGIVLFFPHQLLSLLFFYLRPSAFFFRFAGIALHRTVKDISQIQRLELVFVPFLQTQSVRQKMCKCTGREFLHSGNAVLEMRTVKELCSFLADLFRMIKIK